MGKRREEKGSVVKGRGLGKGEEAEGKGMRRGGEVRNRYQRHIEKEGGLGEGGGRTGKGGGKEEGRWER